MNETFIYCVAGAIAIWRSSPGESQLVHSADCLLSQIVLSHRRSRWWNGALYYGDTYLFIYEQIYNIWFHHEAKLLLMIAVQLRRNGVPDPVDRSTRPKVAAKGINRKAQSSCVQNNKADSYWAWSNLKFTCWTCFSTLYLWNAGMRHNSAAFELFCLAFELLGAWFDLPGWALP